MRIPFGVIKWFANLVGIEIIDREVEVPEFRGLPGAFNKLLVPGIAKEFRRAYELYPREYEIFIKEEDPEMFMYLMLLTLWDGDIRDARQRLRKVHKLSSH